MEKYQIIEYTGKLHEQTIVENQQLRAKCDYLLKLLAINQKYLASLHDAEAITLNGIIKMNQETLDRLINITR